MADEQKKPARDKGNKKGPEVVFLCACLFPRERELQLQKRFAEVHTKEDRWKLFVASNAEQTLPVTISTASWESRTSATARHLTGTAPRRSEQAGKLGQHMRRFPSVTQLELN